MFLFIVKVASDLCVPKSNDQFLVFTIVDPAVLFDTDDIPHFLDVLHWASSESVSWFCCCFSLFPVSLASPSQFYLLYPHFTNTKFWSGAPLCVSKLAL